MGGWRLHPGPCGLDMTGYETVVMVLVLGIGTLAWAVFKGRP